MMFRRLAGLFGLACLVLVPAASAAAEEQGAAKAGDNRIVIRVVTAKVQLNDDGTVSVPLRIRCSPPLDAFELDVSVNQGTASGSTTLLGTPFPVCNGKWQRIAVTVAPTTGAFVPGPATVGVFLGTFDPVGGNDVDAEASATVTL